MEEAIKFRDKCLIEFKEKNNHLKLLEMYYWNAAIEAAAKIAEEWANGTASEIRKLKK